MVDSSIFQVFQSSHGNHGLTSTSLGKYIDSDNSHPSPASLGKPLPVFPNQHVDEASRYQVSINEQ